MDSLKSRISTTSVCVTNIGTTYDKHPRVMEAQFLDALVGGGQYEARRTLN